MIEFFVFLVGLIMFGFLAWWHGYLTGWRRMFNITIKEMNAKHPKKEPLPLYSIPKTASWVERLGRRVFVGKK